MLSNDLVMSRPFFIPFLCIIEMSYDLPLRVVNQLAISCQKKKSTTSISLTHAFSDTPRKKYVAHAVKFAVCSSRYARIKSFMFSWQSCHAIWYHVIFLLSFFLLMMILHTNFTAFYINLSCLEIKFP